LEHPAIRLAIVPQVFAKGREIDCVLVFEDSRAPNDMWRTTQGFPVQSFVACVEIKNHSSDAVLLHGTHLEVCTDGKWLNATSQADAQVWALKNFQKTPYLGKTRRDKTFVQSVIWLRRVPPDALGEVRRIGRSSILYEDLSWQQMIDCFEINTAQKKVQTLVSSDSASLHHSYDSLVRTLTAKVEPTRLDLKRVNELTKKKFDADKTDYVRALGKELLVFKGRAGTGKTFALIQMAIYLARQGKSTRIVTYNHGLISDMSRAMSIIRDRNSDIAPIPNIDTRWMLMRQLFELTFGADAVKCAGELYDLENREALFLRALRNPNSFLLENVPCCTINAAGKDCRCGPTPHQTWANVCMYRDKFPPPYDFLLVDEGQDWTTEHRDLMYDIFGSNRVIVADGVDQFVNENRCDWKANVSTKDRSIITLKTSQRTKAATCDTIADIAQALGVPDWDVVPDKSVAGGRITVLVEPQPRRALERALDILATDLAKQPTLRPVDTLICLPQPAATPKSNYCNLFEAVQDQKQADYWRGYDWETRQNREYPDRQSQLRAVLYQSCRGMEGWTTLCMGLDVFYSHTIANPDIDTDGLRAQLKADQGFLFNESAFEEDLTAARRAHAVNWLMIAITRSMDHLVIHLANADSALGQVLQRIDRDKISWR